MYDNEKIIETGNVTAAVTYAPKTDGTESGPEDNERFALRKALKTISGEKSTSTETLRLLRRTGGTVRLMLSLKTDAKNT